MASNWGLIDHATAAAPLEQLAQILAQSKAEEEARFKRAGEEQTRGIALRNAQVNEGQLGLQRDKFGAEQATAAKGDQEFEQAIAAAPDWQKPVLRLQRIGVKWSPREAIMSPDEQHAQQIQDETGKAAAAAAAQETARQAANAFTTQRDQTQHGYRMQEAGVRKANGETPIPSASTARAADPNAGPDEGYLKSLPQGVGDQVKALAEGRMSFPTGTALKDSHWQQMLNAVARYDPSFDAVNYNARSSTRKSFTSGKEAGMVNTLNTALGHLHELNAAIDALDNYDTPAINTVKNWFGKATGKPGVTAVETIRNRVAPELVSAYRGSGGAEADIERNLKDFDVNASPAQNKAALQETAKLLRSKIASLEDQYKQGMGSHALSLLSPAAQKTLDELEGKSTSKPTAAELLKKYGGG